MPHHDLPPPGAFCWLDLAARDATLAKRFYAEVFGWSFGEQVANGGHFERCRVGDRDVGSLYQLKQAQLDHGVPSHWTPYVRVTDVEATARQAATCAGRVVVMPFTVPGVARISLIQDATGALVGLWQPVHDATPSRH